MAADRRFECTQCLLLHSMGNRRDQERTVNLLRGLRRIEAAPAVLQLVVALRFQILQFLCEPFGFGIRYYALHIQLLTVPTYTHIARFPAGSQSCEGVYVWLVGSDFADPIRLPIAPNVPTVDRRQ